MLRLVCAILLVLGVDACQASPSTAPASSTARPGQTSPAVASSPVTSPGAGSTATLPTAVLGGPEERFVARLGPPGPDSVPGTVDHFQRVAGTTCDPLVVFFSGHLARAVVGQTCSGPTPAPADRLADANRYAPADRVPGSSFQTANGDAGMTFTSATLARQLPASAFHDCNGQPLPAGTFAEFLSTRGWEIATGTCP